MNSLLIGRRLRAARIAAGFEDPAVFAKELSLRPGNYRRIEDGRDLADLETVVAVSDFTGKSVEFLVRGRSRRGRL